MDFFLGLIVGVFLGIFLVFVWARHKFDQLISVIEESNEFKELMEKDNNILGRVELHDNMYFIYNNDTNEFLAQGQNIQELKTRVSERFKQVNIKVVAGDEVVLHSLKDELKKADLQSAK